MPPRPRPTPPAVIGVPPATIKALLRSARQAKEGKDGINESYGSEVKAAVERKHLHRGVYGKIVQLDRLTPEELADWKDHFDHQWVASGLAERAASAPRLPGTDEPHEQGGVITMEQGRAALQAAE